MTSASPGERRAGGLVALILAGGGARGAYEVGVVRHLVEDVARTIGREVPLDLLCGTSIGAINVCGLATWADTPAERGRLLEEKWLSLRLSEVLRIDRRGVVDTLRGLLGRPPPLRPQDSRRGGLLHTAALEKIVRGAAFERIGEHLRARRLTAVSVSATHIASGRTVVFVQRASDAPLDWGGDPTVTARVARLRPEHALASAAIPLLFPAVKVDDAFYADGGLRENTPLLPARRLGASAAIVVNPRYPPLDTPDGGAREEAFPGPQFLIGKALDALLLDRIDAEVEQVLRMNTILGVADRLFGPTMLEQLNAELLRLEVEPVRPLRLVVVRPSQDLGKLAAELVRSPRFEQRRCDLQGAVLRRLAEGEARDEADFLSYLLFDDEFARQLIELGRADAAAQHEALCQIFAPA